MRESFYLGQGEVNMGFFHYLNHGLATTDKPNLAPDLSHTFLYLRFY